MKKAFMLLVVLLLTTGLVACDTNGDRAKNDDVDNRSVTPSTPNDDTNPDDNERRNNSDDEGPTLENAIKKYKEKGIKAEKETPSYEAIFAKNGVIFYIGDEPVKIYEFENEEMFEAGSEALAGLRDMPRKGLLVLETANERAIEIFNELR